MCPVSSCSAEPSSSDLWSKPNPPLHHPRLVYTLIKRPSPTFIAEVDPRRRQVGACQGEDDAQTQRCYEQAHVGVKGSGVRSHLNSCFLKMRRFSNVLIQRPLLVQRVDVGGDLKVSAKVQTEMEDWGERSSCICLFIRRKQTTCSATRELVTISIRTSDERTNYTFAVISFICGTISRTLFMKV